MSNFQGVILIADPKRDPCRSLRGASAGGALCTGSSRSRGFVGSFEEFLGAREVVIGPTPHEIHHNHLATRHETSPKQTLSKSIGNVEECQNILNMFSTSSRMPKSNMKKWKIGSFTMLESEDLRL
jgi:hypothetical protein